MGRQHSLFACVVALTLTPLSSAQPNLGKPFSLDGDGKRLPPGALARLGVLRLRHAEAVESIALGPDGKTLISTGRDQTSRLWDITTGKELRRFTAAGDRWGFVAASPNGKLLASTVSGENGHEIQVRDAATTKKIRSLRCEGFQDLSPVFSADGKYLASANQGLQVWEVSTGRELLRSNAHEERLVAMAFSPDGMTLATADRGQTIRLWDHRTGRQLRHWKGHAPVFFTGGMVFSPDGKTLASASHDKTIRMWQTETGKEIRCLKGHSKSVNSLAFSPDGLTIASSGWDRTCLWDVGTGKVVWQLTDDRVPLYALAFSEDGSRASCN